MNAQRLLEHYERIADAPHAIARLRHFILDLAVRGKLALQASDDEPALELLKRIADEKARLVKAGMIRKQDVEPVASKEAPFELPANWAWTRIGEISSKTGSGSTPRGGQSAYHAEGVPFLRSQNVYDDGLRLGDVVYIDQYTHNRMNGTAVQPNDLLLNITGGSIGRCCPVPAKFFEANISQHVAIIRFVISEMQAFMHRVILSPYFQLFIFGEQTGAGREGLPKNRMDRIPVALPPLAEQQRIVAKVDELMALCDQLEAARASREAVLDRLAAATLARLNAPDSATFHDDARFTLQSLLSLTTRPDQIKQLRQTILNLAVRGKLVPQDPRDEPALELIKQIAAERADLVKNRMIRSDKPLDPVQAAEQPFDVPKCWIWSRIGDAVLFTQYGTSLKSHPAEKGIPVLTMGNIQDGLIVWGNEKRIPDSSEELPALFLSTFDLLYNRTNSAELVGKTGIYLGESNVRTFASYLIRLRPSLKWSNPQYLNMAMNTSVFRETQIVPLIKKQTGQANVNGTALKNMLLPLPPLVEQHRIVAKVDALMALCNQLEAILNAADATRSRLLDALLVEALAPAPAREVAA